MQVNSKYKALIEGCKINDRKSQEKLYRMFFPKMLSMCRRYTQDEDQQISILNDGFLKVFKKIGDFNYSGSFEGWVRRLVFTSLSDYFRKENKYVKFMIFDTPEVTLSERPDDDLYYQDVIRLMDLLPHKTKRVFEMYAIEGYPHKDIASQLSISIGTSKWHLSEARKQLQAHLKKQNVLNSNVR